MQIGVITNPNSRKNRGKTNRAVELQNIVGQLGEVRQTDTVGAIKPILREFLRRRARYWVADGGDGALHHMVKAGLEILEEEEFRGPNYTLPLTVPTNGGTIDFVAHNVGIRGKAEEVLGALRGALESGQRIEEVEVDSMRIEGTEMVEGRPEAFRTYGFACAAGGIGQRFYAKYYAHEDPNPKTIVKVISTTLASMPVALSPLRAVPGLPGGLKKYAREMFEPCQARVSVDGMVLPHRSYRGIHVASMSIHLGGLLRFFPKADIPGQLHCLVGAPNPFVIARNLPAMHLGREIRGRDIVDRPCRELAVEAVGDELLAPIIDGEYYRNVKTLAFKVGPRLRIPKVVSR